MKVKLKISYLLLVLACMLGVLVTTPQNTHAATNAALKSKLLAITSEPIRKLICEDLNEDGEKEVYIPTGVYRLHGVLEPASRKVRTTFTETEPMQI